MGVMIIIWGGLLMTMAAPRYFAGMAALRTLLGAAEALVTPGFVLLVSRFYKREEQPLRVGIWYCCNGLGSFIGALVSYGMGHVNVKGVPSCKCFDWDSQAGPPATSQQLLMDHRGLDLHPQVSQPSRQNQKPVNVRC
jgi:MFS family permease